MLGSLTDACSRLVFLLTENRNDPAGNGAESESDQQASGPVAIVAPDSAPGLAFRNAYGVLVRGKSVRRHLYLSLSAAERTVKRARERGDRADLVLVQLVPVDARELHLSSEVTA